MSRAADTFSELSIVPAQSPLGYMYRVVDGPMADHASAQERLQKALSAGFAGAWLLLMDRSVVKAPEAHSKGWPAPDTAGELLAAGTGSDDNRTSNSSADVYSENRPNSSGANGYGLEDSAASDAYSDAPSSADYEPVAIGSEELVETAPAGYGLNQLQRSIMTAAPGASPNSRLRELQSRELPEKGDND